MSVLDEAENMRVAPHNGHVMVAALRRLHLSPDVGIDAAAQVADDVGGRAGTVIGRQRRLQLGEPGHRRTS